MPIIKSLLDMDFYKYTMDQAIWFKHKDNPSLFAFKCRTPCVSLPKIIYEGDLRRELDHVRTLQRTDEEIDYLRKLSIKGKRIFREEYLQWLKPQRLPEYHLETYEDTFRIEFEGSWAEVTFWETICLSIAMELYIEGMLGSYNKTFFKVGSELLDSKIETIKGYPGLRIIDFGTRRRASRIWQGAVLEELISELKDGQLVGTSNVMFAKQFGIQPKGTTAHELDHGVEGILRAQNISHETLRNVHPYVMDWWEGVYPYDLRINLPDTYSSDLGLSQMTKERMQNWKGERQDSGPTIPFGEKRIRKYKQFGIDPREKSLFFSDGLEIESIVRLYEHFAGRIQVAFGWGTNLMNNLIFDPISIVVKLVRSNDVWTVKLSDNLAKAVGREEDIEAAKAALGYTNKLYEPCKY